MENLEYHKGSFCIYASVFCQEGYCSGCEINTKRQLATKQCSSPEIVRLQKTPELITVH